MLALKKASFLFYALFSEAGFSYAAIAAISSPALNCSKSMLKSMCTIFGGFAPNSQTASALSQNLGCRTVLSGSVTQGKDNNSQSLQMMERPLMSADELKSMSKGSFVVMKTGTHPMKTKLKLFFEWGIRFEKPLEMPDRGSRPVHYAGKAELEKAILSEYPLLFSEELLPTQTPLKPAPMPEKTALKT